MRLKRFRDWIILSLLVHLTLVAGIFIVTLLSEVEPPPVAIELIDLKPQPRRQAQDILRNQIVAQKELPDKNEPPPETRFLSAQNQTVQKETVARKNGEFKNAESKVAGKKDKPSFKDLSPQFDPLAIKENQQNEKRGDEVSQSDDYLKGVETGDQTILNTREFRYYTYYSRIRRQLSHHWEPRVREKLARIFRQGRRIASDKDHITKLLIVLNTQGVLVKVQVVSESGVHDLDDAATEAFKSAAPFPNPPAGIVESDGYVKIRWDFVLES